MWFISHVITKLNGKLRVNIGPWNILYFKFYKVNIRPDKISQFGLLPKINAPNYFLCKHVNIVWGVLFKWKGGKKKKKSPFLFPTFSLKKNTTLGNLRMKNILIMLVILLAVHGTGGVLKERLNKNASLLHVSCLSHFIYIYI